MYLGLLPSKWHDVFVVLILRFFFVFSSFFAASAGSEQGSLRVFQRISGPGVFLVFLNFAGLVYSLRSSNLKFIREWHKSFAFNPSDAQMPVAGCGAVARYTIALTVQLVIPSFFLLTYVYPFIWLLIKGNITGGMANRACAVFLSGIHLS